MPTEPPQRSTWMKDYETAICLNCNLTIFSMFNRRHHCRRCGRVVCGSCSMKKLKVKFGFYLGFGVKFGIGWIVISNLLFVTNVS